CLLKSVGKKGPNKVICIPSQRAEPGLITLKGYTSKKKKRNHVIKVRKANANNSSKYFSRYFKVPTCSTLTYLYVRTLPRCKRCAQGGV
ncbi:hypothetical protein L249_8985, partial [Ophiocordyceps polyrhachis-furcata BCC 54312]